jgi:NADH:ubiquinone oxidoreductase subunit F (NADH-binding)
MSFTSELSDPTEVELRARAPEGELPRLLAGIPAGGALALSEHVRLHGRLPALRGHGRRADHEHAEQLLREVEDAGLLGHGGAAFPLARKLRAVAGARGRAIVLVNGVEAEPASFKDRTLLEALPHLAIDGAAIAAQAIGADEIVLGVRETAVEAIESVSCAIEERARSSAQSHIDGALQIRVCAAPTHFVAGQESALVSLVGGGEAKPAFTPPLPFERGVARRPTLVSNVETLAHLALIARHGARWFRQLGTAAQPGSALVTLSGPVAHPGVYEIEHGASLHSLIEAAGGALGGVRAALIGGYSGAFIDATHLRGVALSNEHLAPHGGSFGAGVIVLLSDEACPVAEATRLARWLASQSARQCGPCLHGLDALARGLEELMHGERHGPHAERVTSLPALIERRGACRHPDGALNIVLSALEAFSADFAEHSRRGACAACARGPELPLPAVSPDGARPRGRARR